MNLARSWRLLAIAPPFRFPATYCTGRRALAAAVAMLLGCAPARAQTNYNVSDTATFSTAISSVANGDTITFTADIALSAVPPALTKSVTLIGNGHALTGADGAQAFVFSAGAVTINDLFIAEDLRIQNTAAVTNLTGIAIGQSSTGSLIVNGGGNLATGNSSVGQGGVGSATVTGANSIWTGGYVTFGDGYAAGLQVLAGGKVANLITIVGNNLTATALVSGTGSRLEGRLRLGFFPGGAGTITVADGGVVQADVVEIGNFGGAGAIFLNGSLLNGRGVIETSSIGNQATLTSATLDIDGGILRVSADNPDFLSGFANGDVTLHSGGVFFDTNGFDIAVSAVLDGTGGKLIKQGAGTLALSGPNTYDGGTTINGGTLAISANANLGAASGGLTFDGGRLKYLASFINNRAVTLNAGGGTFDLNGFNSSMNGDITGTGGLTITGAGTFILSNPTSYSGATSVTGGATLQTNGVDNLLSAASAYTFASGTTLDLAGRAQAIGSLAGAGRVTNTGNVLAALTTGGSGASTIFSGVLTNGSLGAVSLIKVGAGTFTLTGANTSTGGMTISAGTLSIGSGGATGSLAGDIANNAALIFNRSNAVTFAGVISGSGTLTKLGGGTLSLTGANIYNGGTTISAGALSIGSGGATGSLTGNIVNNAALIFNRSGTLAYTGAISGTGTVTKSGAGTVTLSGASNYNGVTTVAAGTLAVDETGAIGPGAATDSSGVLLFQSAASAGSRPITVNGGQVRFINAATAGSANIVTNTLGSAFFRDTASAGTATITNNGTGFTSFDGNATANSVTINTGVGTYIDITGLTTAGITIGSISGAGNVHLGAKILTTGGLNTSTTIGGVIDDDGGSSGHLGGALVKTGSGTLTLTGTNGFTGGTTISAGILEVGTGGAAGSLAGVVTNNAAIRFNRSDASTFGGTIGGSGTFTKSGAGTLTLSGASNYTGATAVAAGRLNVNGSLGATGVTVASGATLGGAGTLGGAVTIQVGGHLAPGTSAGTLTVSSLGLVAGSILDYELDTPGVVGGGVNDLIVVTGDLTLDGTLNTTTAGGFGAGAYRLFNYGGALTDNGLALGALPTSFNYSLSTAAAGQINLVVSGLAPPGPPPVPSVQFWDGGGNLGDDVIGGGGGGWDATTTNWTGADGSANAAWGGLTAVFTGPVGTVTASGTLGFDSLQFMTTGFSLIPGANATLTPTATAAVRVDPGVTATVAAPFTGIGSITKLDTGTLVLTGANLHTGGTTISGGTLQIGAGGTTGSLAGNVTDNATLAFNRSDDVTFAGVISGSGALTKLGAGALTLSGTNTLTGLTTVSAGTLLLAANSSVASAQITSGATLRGVGTIRGGLTNGGTVSPGFSPGTLTVRGNYTQSSGGRLVVELASASSFDQLVVGGTVALDGTLEIVASPGFTVVAGQHFGVISAAGVTGRFATVLSPFLNLPLLVGFESVYTSNSVILGFASRPVADFALTANHRATATALDAAAASGRATALRAEFNTYTTAGQIQQGLNQLSPQRYERWFNAALFNSGALIRAVGNHRGDTPTVPGRAAWTEVVRREADFDGDADLGASELRTDGIIAGLDQIGPGGVVLGGLLAYDDTTLDADGRTRVRTFQPALYFRKTDAAWSTDLMLGYAWDNYTALGKTSGQHWSASARASYGMVFGPVAVTPFAGLHYLRWSADGFDESGASDAALHVAGQRGESFASQAGLRLARSFEVSGVRSTPHVEVAWRHEFQPEPRDLTAELAGASFVVQSRRASVDGWLAALGFDVTVRTNLSLYARFTREGDGAADKSRDFRAGVNCRF